MRAARSSGVAVGFRQLQRALHADPWWSLRCGVSPVDRVQAARAVAEVLGQRRPWLARHVAQAHHEVRLLSLVVADDLDPIAWVEGGGHRAYRNIVTSLAIWSANMAGFVREPAVWCQGQNRTADTAVFSRVLYLLSYLARAQIQSSTRTNGGRNRARTRDLLGVNEAL